MEENNSNELNKAHEKDIENGGQGLNNEHGEVDAVKNKEKTADQIERMMSQDEIFTVVRENGIYSNMLAPCLSANIFLDGRIMSYFTTPMKPIDLDDKVTDVMQLVLMEISKEQNGVVFKSDGSINVEESIKQSVLNGMQTIPLLRDTMPDGVAEALAQKYYDMNRTGMDAAWGMKRNDDYFGIDKNHLDKILAKGIKDSREALKIYEAHDRYHDIFGHGYSDEERRDLKLKKEENERKIAELEGKATEIKNKMEKLPADSEEYQNLLNQFVAINTEKAKFLKENDKIGNLGEPKLEEVQAKGLLAEVRIMQLLGFKDKSYRDISLRIKDLCQNSSIARLAIRQEGATSEITKTYLDRISKQDINKMQEYKDALTKGTISEEDRSQYLIESLKNYYTYTTLQSEKAKDYINQDIVNININQAIEGIILTVPNAKGKDGNLDWDRILKYVSENTKYKDLDLEGLRTTFLLDKSKDIQQEMDITLQSAEIDFPEEIELDDKEFVEKFKENDKELDLIKYMNYFRRLKDKGIDNAPCRMFKYKLEKEGMHHILEKADEIYENSEVYVEEMMDNYKRGFAFSKYRDFQKFSDRDKKMLTKDEKGVYISAMIAAYDISRDETEISMEVQSAAKDVFGTFLGDVFDEHGDVDDEKLFAQYKKMFKTSSKFALGKESEDINAFFEFHEATTLNKVQKKIVGKFMETVNDRKKDLSQEHVITEPEIKSKVDERGETLDDSAITDPKKTVEPKAPAEITKKEAEEAMDKKGETMRVDDPKVVEIDKTVAAAPPIDKKKEEEGNTLNSEDTQNKNNSLVVKDEGKNIFAKAWKFIKEKVSNIFGGSSSSDTNNNATTGGGNVVENKQVQQIEAKNDNWVAPAIVNIKQAQADAKAAKAEKEAKEAEEAEKPMNDDGPTL